MAVNGGLGCAREELDLFGPGASGFLDDVQEPYSSDRFFIFFIHLSPNLLQFSRSSDSGHKDWASPIAGWNWTALVGLASLIAWWMHV